MTGGKSYAPAAGDRRAVVQWPSRRRRPCTRWRTPASADSRFHDHGPADLCFLAQVDLDPAAAGILVGAPAGRFVAVEGHVGLVSGPTRWRPGPLPAVCGAVGGGWLRGGLRIICADLAERFDVDRRGACPRSRARRRWKRCCRTSPRRGSRDRASRPGRQSCRAPAANRTTSRRPCAAAGSDR